MNAAGGSDGATAVGGSGSGVGAGVGGGEDDLLITPIRRGSAGQVPMFESFTPQRQRRGSGASVGRQRRGSGIHTPATPQFVTMPGQFFAPSADLEPEESFRDAMYHAESFRGSVGPDSPDTGRVASMS